MAQRVGHREGAELGKGGKYSNIAERRLRVGDGRESRQADWHTSMCCVYVDISVYVCV